MISNTKNWMYLKMVEGYALSSAICLINATNAIFFHAANYYVYLYCFLLMAYGFRQFFFLFLFAKFDAQNLANFLVLSARVSYYR